VTGARQQLWGNMLGPGGAQALDWTSARREADKPTGTRRQRRQRHADGLLQWRTGLWQGRLWSSEEEKRATVASDQMG
jgi:hypothetical protein